MLQTPDFAALQPGDELPPLEIPITPTLVVGGESASRDFYAIHHDRKLAEELGSPDIFMNILTTHGRVGRYSTDGSGPGSRLKKIAIRLGVPNYPGDTMRMSGKITARDEEQRTVEVELYGKNSMGNHVSGTAVVEFRAGAED